VGSPRCRVHGNRPAHPWAAVPEIPSVGTDELAQIELGKLPAPLSRSGRPEAGATVAQLLDECAAIAQWDTSTRATNEGFIRRTTCPAVGYKRVREVRGRRTCSCQP
jgi:hypothetical protein